MGRKNSKKRAPKKSPKIGKKEKTEPSAPEVNTVSVESLSETAKKVYYKLLETLSRDKVPFHDVLPLKSGKFLIRIEDKKLTDDTKSFISDLVMAVADALCYSDVLVNDSCTVENGLNFIGYPSLIVEFQGIHEEEPEEWEEEEFPLPKPRSKRPKPKSEEQIVTEVTSKPVEVEEIINNSKQEINTMPENTNNSKPGSFTRLQPVTFIPGEFVNVQFKEGTYMGVFLHSLNEKFFVFFEEFDKTEWCYERYINPVK